MEKIKAFLLKISSSRFSGLTNSKSHQCGRKVLYLIFFLTRITSVPLFLLVTSLNWRLKVPPGKALKPVVLTNVIVIPNTEVKGHPQWAGISLNMNCARV